jgi:hypothetical protein
VVVVNGCEHAVGEKNVEAVKGWWWWREEEEVQGGERGRGQGWR